MASQMSLLGCTTPVSLLANITVTRQVSVRKAADNEETSTEPADWDTGRIVKSGNVIMEKKFTFTSKKTSVLLSINQPIVPSLLHCLRGRSTAGCSMFVVMTWGNFGIELVSEIEFLHQDL